MVRKTLVCSYVNCKSVGVKRIVLMPILVCCLVSVVQSAGQHFSYPTEGKLAGVGVVASASCVRR
jgi:hypothetical protein